MNTEFIENIARIIAKRKRCGDFPEMFLVDVANLPAKLSAKGCGRFVINKGGDVVDWPDPIVRQTA